MPVSVMRAIRGMTDKIPEAVAKQLWDAAQRIGIRIAELQLNQRDEAFATCDKAFQEAARDMGVSEVRIGGLIKLQMEAVRGMVTNIDLGGSPQGGRA
jgi:hypothetical protein